VDLELDKKLCEKYPEIFANRHNKNEPIVWGFECRDGWFILIDRLCGIIQNRIKYNPETPQVVAIQVKEKFGRLRFYYSGGDDYIRGAVDLAEYCSGNICESCGTKSIVKDREGWYTSICDECIKDIK
jgi:hypothetical protein